MKVLCIGAGAIGICIGGSLAAQGADVTFLVKEKHRKKFEGRELIIQSESSRIQTDAYALITDSRDLPPKTYFDCLLVAVKTFDTDALIKQLKKSDLDFHTIVCLQNGVENEDKFQQAFPEKGIIGASIVSAVSMLDDISVKIEKDRGIGLAGSADLLDELDCLLDAANLKSRIIANLRSMKWSKMISNLFANATSAILDMTPYEIYKNKALFRIEREQIRETLAVMKKMGVKAVNLPGLPLRLLVWVIENLPGFLLQSLLIQLVAKGRGDKMPSFYIEKMKGSVKSEVNDLNGAVVRFGEEFGVPVPVNTKLTEVLNYVLKDKKAGRIYSRNPDKLIQNLNI